MSMSGRPGVWLGGKDCVSRESGHRAEPRILRGGIWLKDGNTIGVVGVTFSLSVSSDIGGSGCRLGGMVNFTSGSIDKVALKGSEGIRGTEITSLPVDADDSGQDHRADGVARRSVGEGWR